MSERILLLGKTPSKTPQNTHLSVIFAIVCIVDVFGVFPLVTLPKAIIDCGFYGILVVFIVCSIQMYTAIILGKCWLLAEELDSTIHLKNRYPYSALAEMTFGTKFANFVTCLLDVTIFAGGIPNLIVASQNLELLVQRLALSNNISYCYWMMVLGAVLCPFLWFGSPKDMKLLCSLSVCLVGSVFLLLCGCIIFDDTTHSEPQSTLTNNLPLWNKILTAYGVIVFQFDIHPTIFTIQVDMEEKQKLHKAIFGGFGASLTMFTITSLCVAIKYGENVNLSLLESIPSSAFLHMCAFLVALQLGLTSTISNSALYQHMEDCLGISREFNHKRCIIRTALIVLAVLLAETVPRFDLVMAMIGGTLTGPIVFIFPPLFYIKMLYFKTDFDTKSERTSIENVACNQYEHLFSGLLETKDNQRVQNLRADRNGNQLLETNELAEWIRLRVIEHITTSVRNNFGLFSIIDNNPKNNLVSWEEYHAYFLKKRGFNTDYIEKHDEIAHGGLKRPIKEQIMKDKAAWSEVIHSNPEGLTIDEFLTFTHPESSTTKMLALVEDLYDKFDCDGDEILTEDEFAVYQPEGDADNPLFIAKQNQDERRAEFRNAIDTNKDGKADKRELLMYVAPHNRRHSEHEAAALVAIADVNHDNALSFTEITANPDMFIKSKMVETAQSFHDEF